MLRVFCFWKFPEWEGRSPSGSEDDPEVPLFHKTAHLEAVSRAGFGRSVGKAPD
jgi:hypothetical protein